MLRTVQATALLLVALLASGCQSPTEPSDLNYFEITAPTSVSATGPSGRTHVIAATDTTPERIVEFPWVARVEITVRITPDANHEDGKLDFPVQINGANATVAQASGGIVVPPPTGTLIYSETLPFAPGGNTFNAVNDTIAMTFDVYYDLPNKQKEALITFNFSFITDDDDTLSDSVQVRVSP